MKKIVLFLGVFACLVKNLIVAENIKYINKQPVIPVEELLKIRPDITYTQLSDSLELHLKESPLFKYGFSWWEKDTIVHPKRFVLSIPDGKVSSSCGFVIVDNMYIDEFVWAPIRMSESLYDISKLKTPKKIHSKIAVITQAGNNNYYHWMVEVLPKLAMLQESGIAYDYIYLPLTHSYMKETIRLLGIDVAKIIEPTGSNQYIQADELIVPSPPSSFNHLTQFVISFLRNSFIPLAEKTVDCRNFAKRIFISRSGSNRRKIINEDEVFALFEQYGFVRYNSEKLSVLEQIALFHNAEFIVGEHGAGLTNMIFAQPGTQVLEIFQARKHMGFWYLCQELGLQYTCVKTIEFDERSNQSSQSCNAIPLDPIRNIVNQLLS